MIDNFDYAEDIACTREYTFDVEGDMFWLEPDIEAWFEE